MLEKIKWLGHAAFKIQGPKVIYIDPYQLPGRGEPADIVLITHEHFDHFSKEDVEKVRKLDTIFVTTAAVKSELSGDVRVVKPGDRLTVDGIDIEVVPAYNLTKFRAPGVPFHPKPDAKVGFVLTVEGQRIYHAGDTDLIPEMDNIRCDVALLPVSGTYVMTAEEAAEAARRIRPRIAVPMHWGAIVGSMKDALRFKELLEGQIEVHIPEKVAP